MVSCQGTERSMTGMNLPFDLMSAASPPAQWLHGLPVPGSCSPISYCMSGVGPSILCYVPKSPNGQLLETPVRYLKGRLWSQSQELHEFRPIRPLLSTSDKEKVHACVPQRWNETVQSGDSLGGGGTNSRMVDLSSRRIAKNLSLAKALTGNRAANTSCVLHTCGKLGERIWLY